MHNVAAGGILGYVGVSRGRLGVPFVSPYFLYGMRYPGLVGAAVVSVFSVWLPSAFVFDVLLSI